MRTFKVEFDKQSLYTPAIIPPSIVICGAHSAPTKFFLCALCGEKHYSPITVTVILR